MLTIILNYHIELTSKSLAGKIISVEEAALPQNIISAPNDIKMNFNGYITRIKFHIFFLFLNFTGESRENTYMYKNVWLTNSHKFRKAAI